MRCYFLYSDSFYAFSSPCHCYEVLALCIYLEQCDTAFPRCIPVNCSYFFFLNSSGSSFLLFASLLSSFSLIIIVLFFFCLL